ncbi:hypothetical protein MESS4_830006 [Mesorhizobium sp. STM 4661]|nr:hypothetical protein MESS4_830006 [Mesorhizobium sp. STM 4661]
MTLQTDGSESPSRKRMTFRDAADGNDGSDGVEESGRRSDGGLGILPGRAERLGTVSLRETVTAPRASAFRLGGTTCVTTRPALSPSELASSVELTRRRGSSHSLAH